MTSPRPWGVVLVLVGMGYAFGCAVPSQGMTPGIYTDPTREEKIVVGDSKIAFDARTRSGARFSREYDLWVGPDGRIQPGPLASADALYGVGSYEWWWDGKNIVREDRKTGEKVEFSRETAP